MDPAPVQQIRRVFSLSFGMDVLSDWCIHTAIPVETILVISSLHSLPMVHVLILRSRSVKPCNALRCPRTETATLWSPNQEPLMSRNSFRSLFRDKFTIIPSRTLGLTLPMLKFNSRRFWESSIASINCLPHNAAFGHSLSMVIMSRCRKRIQDSWFLDYFGLQGGWKPVHSEDMGNKSANAATVLTSSS